MALRDTVTDHALVNDVYRLPIVYLLATVPPSRSPNIGTTAVKIIQSSSANHAAVSFNQANYRGEINPPLPVVGDADLPGLIADHGSWR